MDWAAKKFAFIATAAVLGTSLSTVASATPIFSANFEELSPALSVSSVGAFTAINGTNVDVVNNTMGFGPLCAGPTSGNCVDLGGSGGDPNSVLRSNFLFNVGQYLLSFDLIGSGR